MTKIYTKTGDKGTTALFGGTRVLKSNVRVEAYGTIDELNSVLGVIRVRLSDKKIAEFVESIQHDLFTIGSTLANPKNKKIEQLPGRIDKFEQQIDEMTDKMPLLRNFILPGGGEVGALFHQARTVCRRAERRIVELMQTDEIDDTITKYINRLSDVLFTLARYVNFTEGKEEIKWIK